MTTLIGGHPVLDSGCCDSTLRTLYRWHSALGINETRISGLDGSLSILFDLEVIKIEVFRAMKHGFDDLLLILLVNRLHESIESATNTPRSRRLRWV